MKKFFSAFLLMTAMVLSVGTFVACNDLVDDVEDLKSQTTQNAADIAAIKTQIATLEQGIAEAKQAAADAKTFAEKCAAEAKAEALAAAKEYAESLNNATQAELATLKGMVEGIDARLSTLEGTVDEQAKAIAGLDEQITALKKYAEDKVAEIVAELEAMKADILANANNIASLQTDLKAVQEKIAEIDEALVTLEELVYNVLKSIAYIPEKIDSTLNEIEDGFKSIMRCNTDDSAYEYISSNCVEFTYRVNPANAEVKKEDLSFIAIDVQTRAEEYTDVFEIVDMAREEGSDRLVVTVKSKTNIPGDKQTGLDGKKAKLVALKVANDNYSIVSDYTAVADVDLKTYAIRNKKAEDKVNFFNYHWHATRPTTLGDPTVTEFYPVATQTIPVELVHSGKVNLREYVETYCTELGATLDAYTCMAPEYEFNSDFTYLSPVDKDTDQNDFVKCTSEGMLEVEFNGALDKVDQASTIVAVGKTPVVEVVAKVAGKAIAKAYIKVDIVEEPTVPPTPKDPVKITFPKKTYKYNELADKDATPTFVWTANSSDYVTWSQLTSKVLADKGIYMSNEMFEQVYYFDVNGNAVTPTHDVTSTVGDVNGVTFSTDPQSATATTTTYVGYALNSLVDENCEATVLIKFESKDVYTYPDVVLEFPFAVTHTTDLPVLNPEYAENGRVVVKGHSNPTATTFEWTYEVFLHEAFELKSYENWTCNNANHSALAFKIDTDSPAILFTDQTMKYTPDLTDDEDWQTVKMTLNLDGEGDHADFETDILYNHNEANAGTVRHDALVDVNDLIWDASGYLDVPVTLYTVLDNGNTCEFEYKVRFVNPFAITLNNISLATSSLGTTYDALKDITITFNGQPVYENADYTQLGKDLKLVGHLGHEFSLVINDAALADDQEEIVKGINDFGYPTDNDSKKWLHWYDTAVIYWNNGGSVLNHDVVFNSTVYGFCDQIGWFTIAQPATVTLLNNK